MSKTSKNIIGRIERIDLPDWDMFGIEAKIDTGAYTSSIHCHHIVETTIDDKLFVRFNILDPEHPNYNGQQFELPIFKKKEVKSSNGQSELRIIIKTRIKLFDEIFMIQLSLSDRSEMKFPILIGRKFLKNRFVVDVSKKNISLKK